MASLALLFGGWILSRIIYSISQKEALNLLKTHMTVSWVQLLVGCAYVLLSFITGLRKAPRLNIDIVKALTPIAACHAFAHACAVLGFGAAGAGLVRIIHAIEPLFTAIFSALFLEQYLPVLAYAGIITVVCGFAIGSAQGFTFPLFALVMAVCSTSAASGRWIFAQKFMRTPQGETMGPANTHALVAVMAAVLFFWLAVLVDGIRMLDFIGVMRHEAILSGPILESWFISGLAFQISNEIAFIALKNMQPVTHAVVRVLLVGWGPLIISVLVFGHPLRVEAIVGYTIAGVGGVMYAFSVKTPPQQHNE